MGKKNKKKNKNKSGKEYKQKLINKFLADGKFTGKEAKKAQKKGITLSRIQKAHTKSFKSGNPFSYDRDVPEWKKIAAAAYNRSSTRNVGGGAGSRKPSADVMFRDPGLKRPVYSPLLIKEDAARAYQYGQIPQQQAATPSQQQQNDANSSTDDTGDDFYEEELYDELPEDEIPEEFDSMNPFGVKQDPISIGNPNKKRRRGGLSQFSAGGRKGGMGTIKSKLLNV